VPAPGVARTADEEPQPVGDPRGELIEGQRAGEAGGQLDAQGQPVDRGTHRVHPLVLR